MLEAGLIKGVIEAGCDEAGRGCLAGPVVAAAVILPVDFESGDLDDSKKLTAGKREVLKVLIEQQALGYGIGIVDEKEIDRVNILNASFLAMEKAVNRLPMVPEHLIIDGNRFNRLEKIPHTCVVKGDGKFASIAAASILAKTYRDALMLKLHRVYPCYGWDRNKGYPTSGHREAIARYGLCRHHRRSFRLLDPQLQMGFS